MITRPKGTKPKIMAELSTSDNGKKRSLSRRKALRVDLTAMVDLAFLLITFFILTTTLRKQQSMDLAMPVNDIGEEGVAASRTLTVVLGNGDKATWYVGETNKPITSPAVVGLNGDNLRKILMEQSTRIKREQGKEMIVLIKPSDQSVYDNLVHVMDELNVTKNSIRAIVDISAGDVAMLKKDKIYN